MSEFGAYTLGKKIGAGGMGEVFLATRVAPGGFDSAQVVIKRVLPGLARQDGFVDRFLDEVRVLARLQHPHVVRVFDFGEVDGQWFIAMEYVDGTPVGALDLPRTGRLGFEIASALDAAHSLRDASGKSTPIVHRDVSPQNILLRASDGAAKLIDFGIASLGGKGAGGGKLGYAAPEQLLEDEASPLSDQYSLGVVLWECLAGRRAFDGEDVEVIRLVTEVGVPPLPASSPLGDTVMRMCSLDPGDRFSSLREVVGLLRSFAVTVAAPSPQPLSPRERGDFDDLAASVDPKALKQTGRTGRVALPSGAATGLSWAQQGANLVLDPGASVSRAFLLTNPARAVFDLDGAAPKKTVTLPASGPHMQSVRLGKLPNGTRVVVDLDEMPRSAKQSEGTLVLTY